MDTRLFTDIATILVVALTGGMIAHRLGQPVILGYLLAGVALGPHTPGITVRPQSVQTVAEFGVALLMFAVGLEFSLRDLAPIRHLAVWGGLLQIALTTALGFALGYFLLGWEWYPSLFLGTILAISSTMIVMKLLGERGELQSRHGLVMLGILIVQDLAVVVMVALLPPLADLERLSLMAVGISLLTVVCYLALAILLSLRLVPWVLRSVAATRSRELVILTSAGICFGAAIGTHQLGFSVALGAFIAGLVISESEFSHEVLADMIPLRDLFASLFFVSIGMIFDPAFLLRQWPAVLLITAAIVVGKAAIVAGVVSGFGYHPRVAVTVGLGLAQIGEFSFVMAKLGLNRGLVSPHFYSLVISAALVTIFATPFLVGAAPRLVTPLSRLLRRSEEVTDTAEQVTEPPQGHVVICGYGRVGGQVGAALEELGVPFSVVDYDRGVIDGLRARGVPAIYGDASHPEVLAHVHAESAGTAVVTVPDLFAAHLVVRRLRATNPELPIVARAHTEGDLDALRREGANEVVLPEFEAGLEVLRYALFHHPRLTSGAAEYVDALRRQRNQNNQPVATG
jgi:monovalent cation:H+ antiporter-2, CPA2 family